MSASIKHSFEVSAEGVKRTLKNTFTKPSTFLQELAQNAERAGASEVMFELASDNRTLIISDDGLGFTEEGWTAFFTVGCSEWSKDVKEAQKPFGIGCASCLFVSDNIKIESNGYTVNLDVELFLQGKEIERKPIEKNGNGTKITLTLKDDFDVGNIKPKIFEGFTIPVFLNNTEVDRIYSNDSKDSHVETELGTLCWNKNEVLKALSNTDYDHMFTNYNVFLQGYVVKEKYPHLSVTVLWTLHLDSKKFEARVPDRDVLIEDSRTEAIDKSVRDIIRLQIKILLKEVIVDDQTALKYFKAAKRFSPELLIDKALPCESIISFTDIAYQKEDSEEESENFVFDENIFKGDLNGKIVFAKPECAMSDLYGGVIDDILNDENEITEHTFLFLYNGLVLNQSLHEDHWLKKDLIHTKNAKFRLDTQGEVIDFKIDGFGSIKVCDSFTLSMTPQNSEIKLTTQPITKTPINFEGALYIPQGTTDYTSIIRHCFNLNCAGEYEEFKRDEAYAERLESILETAVQVRVGKSKSEIIAEMLNFDKLKLNTLAEVLTEEKVSISFTKDNQGNLIAKAA